MQIDIEKLEKKRDDKKQELEYFVNIVDILEDVQTRAILADSSYLSEGTQEIEFLKEKIKNVQTDIKRYNGGISMLKG